jgi:hypothetical protein
VEGEPSGFSELACSLTAGLQRAIIPKKGMVIHILITACYRKNALGKQVALGMNDLFENARIANTSIELLKKLKQLSDTLQKKKTALTTDRTALKIKDNFFVPTRCGTRRWERMLRHCDWEGELKEIK